MQMCDAWAQTRRVQLWQGWAQSRCRCGTGGFATKLLDHVATALGGLRLGERGLDVEELLTRQARFDPPATVVQIERGFRYSLAQAVSTTLARRSC
jgi:hypothetical protein